MRNLKAENEAFRKKNQGLRINLAALNRERNFAKMDDKKRSQKITELQSEIDRLKKENSRLQKEIESSKK